MKNNIKKRAEGFTIIEVLIVLAIAGLIILLVLLAVPALNRNNRNTSRKSDISRIAGALTNFVANNNGVVPSTTGNVDTIIADAGALGQYTFGTPPSSATLANNKVTVVVAGSGTPVALSSGSTDQVQIVTGGICSTGGAATNVNATARNLAIQFTLESGTSGTVTPVCQNI